MGIRLKRYIMKEQEWPHANPCSRCGKQPEQSEIFGIYYVQCRQCDKIEMSVTKKLVTENWNNLYGRTDTHYSKTTPTTDGGRSKEKAISAERKVCAS
ncbi:MAG: hypothetical protein J6S85_05180, partial [Methanobrevibacter sp.]|nr:hypothetical protein [Methanobrevibacter sp.]